MRRVVITGFGIVSCLGHDAETVKDSLYHGRSGIRRNETYAQMGFRSQVSGSITDLNLDELIDRKARRFMGDAAAYAYIALDRAIAMAGLTEQDIVNPRTGLVAGSGGASSTNQVTAAEIAREKGTKACWPIHGATYHVVDYFSLPIYRL